MTSPLGGLNAANWRSITNFYDGNNDQTFDNNGNWTILGVGSDTDLSELETTGGDGGALSTATNLQLSLGGGWRRSPYEDVQLELVLDNGSSFFPQVFWTGGAPIRVSDIDSDGDSDVNDWLQFRA